MLLKKAQLYIIPSLPVIRPSFNRRKIDQQDLNCQPLPTILHTTVHFQGCLLKLGNYFHMSGSRRKKECLLSSSPHFFLVLKNFP